MPDCPRFCVPIAEYDPAIHELIGTYQTQSECLAACNCNSSSANSSNSCHFIECGGTMVHADCGLLPGKVVDCEACECVDASSSSGQSSTNSSSSSSTTTASSSSSGVNKTYGSWTGISNFGANAVGGAFNAGANPRNVDMAYGAGKFVATLFNTQSAGADTLAYSSDGITWSFGKISETSSTLGLGSVTFGNNKFVGSNAYIGANSVFISLDGINWTEQSIGVALNEIGFVNGRFMSLKAGAAYASTDGITWTQTSIGAGNYSIVEWQKPIYANNTVVVFGHGGGNPAQIYVAKSTNDGATWTVNSNPDQLSDGTYLTSMYFNPAYGVNKFVTVCAYYNSADKFEEWFATSADGINWTRLPRPEAIAADTYDGPHNNSENFSRVQYSNGKFYSLVGHSGVAGTDTPFVVSSADGTTWTVDQITNAPPDAPYASVTGANGLIVAVSRYLMVNQPLSSSSSSSSSRSSSSSSHSSNISSSSSSSSVTPIPAFSTWRGLTNFTVSDWHDITYGNNKFLVVRDAGIPTYAYNYAYSADGKTWTYGGIPTGALGGVDLIAFGNGVFVGFVIGSAPDDTFIVRSTDGINWTQQTQPFNNLSSLEFVNNKFIGLRGGDAYTSNDGITWTQATLDASDAFTVWSKPVYANNTIVAFGDSNGANPKAYTIKSTDSGATWTTTATPNTTGSFILQPYNFAYGASKFVTTYAEYAGTTETVNWFAVSDDAINWTKLSRPAALMNPVLDFVSALRYLNGRFYAFIYSYLADNELPVRAVSSVDGVNWVPDNVINTATYSVIRQMAVGSDGQLVAVGNGKVVLNPPSTN